jgi:hypothetical protein
MNGEGFDKALTKPGLSQRGSGLTRFFDAGERQIRRWVAEDARIPQSGARLIRVMIKCKISVEDVECLAGN